VSQSRVDNRSEHAHKWEKHAVVVVLWVVGGVCVAEELPKTHSQRAGKPQSCTQANRQSRKGEESPAAQLKRGPSKFSTPSPPVRVPMGHEAQEEDKEDKQETNKKNPKKKTINQSQALCLSVFVFFLFFFVVSFFCCLAKTRD
jgi:hypothetical protein